MTDFSNVYRVARPDWHSVVMCESEMFSVLWSLYCVLYCCCCCCRTISALMLDQNYINLKSQVIKAERRVLKELGFCVHVKHPHKVFDDVLFIREILICDLFSISVL